MHFVQASPSAPTSLSVPTEVSSVSMLLNPAAFFLVHISLELITYMDSVNWSLLRLTSLLVSVCATLWLGPLWPVLLCLSNFWLLVVLSLADFFLSLHPSLPPGSQPCLGFSSSGFQPYMHPCPDLIAGYHLWAWKAKPSQPTFAADEWVLMWPLMNLPRSIPGLELFHLQLVSWMNLNKYLPLSRLQLP